MLYYPKMPDSKNAPDGRCVAFEKYDGTNLHWDWDRDFGWHSFGTRRDEFNWTEQGLAAFYKAHPGIDGLGLAIAGILGASDVFKTKYPQYNSFRLFTEYLGPNSFAGRHKAEDDKKLVIIDVMAEPFGMIGPEEFVKNFGHLPIARVVYEGKLTGRFSGDVRKGKYDVEEGVVCKGGKGGNDLWMVKIKTYAYMDKLKQAFADNWEDYWE